MQKNNKSIYGLVALLIVFFSINFQHIVNFTDQLSKNNAKNIFQAAVVTNSNKNYIPVAHHVGAPELFTDFAKYPTKTAVRSGDWSSTNTWGGQSIPGANDIVLVKQGVSVVLSGNVDVKTIGVAGTLTFNPSANVNLSIENLLTYPGSALTIIPNDNVTHSIVFDGSLDVVRDPTQLGKGLIAIDSAVTIRGRATARTNARIASAQAGNRTVSVLDDISDWRVGQEVIFSDSERIGDTYVAHIEPVTKKIAGINGRTITLDTPLTHTYRSSVVYSGQNIRFSSTGTTRGHTMFTGDTKLDFSGVYMEKLGRTKTGIVNAGVVLNANGEAEVASNQIGRYSLHAHHLEKPYHIYNNVIVNDDPSLRWMATLHMSYGTFEGNSIVNPGEAGIAVETFLDTGHIKNNLVIGNGGGTYVAVDEFLSFGIWSRSPFVNFEDNRVEGWIKSFSYFIDSEENWSIYINTKFPNIPGGDHVGQVIGGQNTPGVFDRNVNTALVGFGSGNTWRRAAALWVGHILASNYSIDNFTSTHGGILNYYSRYIKVNNAHLEEASEKNTNGSKIGFLGVGVSRLDLTNSTVKGFTIGLTPGNSSNIINTALDNRFDFVSYVGDQICTCHRDTSGETTILDSVTFSDTGKHIVAGAFTIGFEKFLVSGNQDDITSGLAEYILQHPQTFAMALAPAHNIVVKNYNKQPGRDFNVYPTYNSPNFLIPGLGITNKELSEGKGTHPYAAGVVGRSLGDHMVANPIPNSKVIGLVESISPMRVVQDFLYSFPLNTASNYTLKYYTNSFGAKYNINNFLVDYDGETHQVDVKMSRGLNKYQITVGGKPYTLLSVGPDGLPGASSDTINVIPSDRINTTVPPATFEPPASLQTALPPASPPLSATACPYDTNATIPSGLDFVTVRYNSDKLLSSVRGGNGQYRVQPNNLLLPEGSNTISVTIFDSAGRSVSVPCNFNVKKIAPTILVPQSETSTARPTVTITSPQNNASINTGNVAFTGVANGVNPPYKYYWNFGDELSDTYYGPFPPYVLHGFARSGKYTVSLYAVGSNGVKSDTKSVVVNVGTNTTSNTVTPSTLSASCPYDTNVIMPSGQTFNTILPNYTKTFASGGKSPYSVSPQSLSVTTGSFSLPVRVSDSLGQSVTVSCIFNVVNSAVVASNIPNITSVMPSTPVTISDLVTITGTGFEGIYGYDIYMQNRNTGAEINPTLMSLPSGTQIKILIPPIPPGIYDFYLVGPYGNSNLVPITVVSNYGANAFNFLDWLLDLFQKYTP